MTTLALRSKAIHNTFASLNVVKLNWKLLYIVGIVFFTLMLASYIFLINDLTRGAYTIKNYNKEIRQFAKENRILEAEFAETSFLGAVTQKAESLNFQRTTSVKYVQLSDTTLAQAK